jgi:hypothetical protein
MPIFGNEIILTIFETVNADYNQTESARTISFITQLAELIMMTQGLVIQIVQPSDLLCQQFLEVYPQFAPKWMNYSMFKRWYFVVDSLFHAALDKPLLPLPSAFVPDTNVKYLEILINNGLINQKVYSWLEILHDHIFPDDQNNYDMSVSLLKAYFGAKKWFTMEMLLRELNNPRVQK